MVRASGGGSGGAGASDPHHATIPISSDALPSSTGDLSFPTTQRSGSAAVKRVVHFDTSSSSSASASASASASTSTSTSFAPLPIRRGRSRFRTPHRWGPRKALPWASSLCFYCAFLGVAFLLAASLLLPQAGKPHREDSSLASGGVIRFAPSNLLSRLEGANGIDAIRLERGRSGIRSPRLALVLGAMRRESSSLMFSIVAKSLRALGYSLSVFSLDGEESRLFWEKIGFRASILTSENYRRLDWMVFDGIILGSLEAKTVVSSLIQEPFHSIPLIWIIHEDTLANRLPEYKENGWENLIMDWKSSFSRADAVVFPDFPLAMLHSALDAGNFHVITGSPVDAWDAKLYSKSHSKQQLRNDNDFDANDIVILVIGSSFFYDDLPWEHAAAKHVLQPVLTQFAREKGLENSFKFVFLCGNSSGDHASSFQEIASHLGFPHNSIRHYGFDMDINGVLATADVVLYASIHDEQSFPSLLMRSMFFGIPVIAPDLPIIKKYVVDTVNGLIYHPRDVKTLIRAFSLLVSDMELSELAHAIAASGKSLSKNLFVVDFIKEYAKILEGVLNFSSDTILPHEVSEISHIWDWSLYELEVGDKGKFQTSNLYNDSTRNYSIVYSMEEDISERYLGNFTRNDTQSFSEEYPSTLDWEEIEAIETSEEFERKELEEVEERMEKTSGSWEHVHNTARKSERKKFEVNERDEGELERIGSLLCIYEIYNGPGTWPFLHRGALYRGISLSKGVKRPRSDDIDAVDRLPLLNNEYLKDLLCEFGAMLSVAKRVDTLHKIPWIGFQSWRAAGRQFSLSDVGAKVLEEAIIEDRGDVVYFWAKLVSERTNNRGDKNPDFWTMCDSVNNGNCRIIFEDAFRHMYGLPKETAALPPMPEDGGDWSKFHSWVMPTSSFLEFMMFSRMFVDSLHNVSLSSSGDSCLLGSSKIEKGQCYCRVLELLVNVWSYHSARKIIYIDPDNGDLVEQHPMEQRRGMMWVKYFNFALLKSMDEDLAEEADDGLRPYEWLWPLTGEVHWQGILDREREERYRRKMDKHRKSMEKLLERQRHGYKQKALGG